MRFHSTPESALNLEITKLAIIETLVSVGLYVGIGIYFGTFRYLALAILIAPLMLFRTKISTEWGLAAADRVAMRLRPQRRGGQPWGALLSLGAARVNEFETPRSII